LRMESLPLVFGDVAFALAPEGLELLLEAIGLRLKAGIGGEGRVMGCL
jgi:hypothetical protein